MQMPTDGPLGWDALFRHNTTLTGGPAPVGCKAMDSPESLKVLFVRSHSSADAKSSGIFRVVSSPVCAGTVRGVPDFLISAGHEQEKSIAANLPHRMFLMTATVLLTAAMLRGLIASIAPVAGQVGRGLDAGPGLVGLLTSIPVLCFAACLPQSR
jgi:hypothetical protein